MSNAKQVTLEEALAIAQQHHESGNLTLADRTYRDILAVVPDDFTSLHYLGIISYQRGNPQEGVELMKKAIAVHDGLADSWNAYAVMLAQLGNNDTAIEKWEKALELKPDYPEALSNMGNALWELGRFEEARKACQKAVDIKPEHADGYINLGNAIASMGEVELAIETWKKALEYNHLHPNAFINIGNALRDLGRLKESEEHCRRALEIAPDHPDALLNLGNALRDQGSFEEAEEAYRKAISFRPNFIDAHNNLTLVLMSQRRYGEALTAARYVIAFKPDHAYAHSNLAVTLRELGKLEEAEDAARKALQLNPDSAEIKIELADILFLSDRLDEAETLFNDAAEVIPDSPHLYMKLGAVLERANRIEEALEANEKAAELSPEIPEVYYRQALIHYMAYNIPEALKYLDKALEIKPDYPSVLATKSEILQASGDMEGAEKAARDGLKIESLPALYFTLGKLKKYTKDDPDFTAMEKLAKEPQNLGRNQEIPLHFSLFKAYEDIKDYDNAFEHLKKGNDLKRASVVFDRDAQKMTFDKLEETFSPESFQKNEGAGLEDPAPIFIVGMPRSGTTLTEQIIASHPDVYGAGELHYMTEVEKRFGVVTPENATDMGQLYMDRVRGIGDESKNAKMITDKMPGNYMRIGQIVSTLPNAKIIHCQRNPVDTCLSCYKQLFARGHYWSYNLDEMAEHYKLYQGIMSYWREVLPDRFLEIKYEETVNDFENQARKLIDYVGLEWNDACLTPHKSKRSVMTASKGQVRQPVYKTSVEAWRRYEKQLSGFAEQLKDYM